MLHSIFLYKLQTVYLFIIRKLNCLCIFQTYNPMNSDLFPFCLHNFCSIYILRSRRGSESNCTHIIGFISAASWSFDSTSSTILEIRIQQPRFDVLSHIESNINQKYVNVTLILDYNNSTEYI